MTLARGLKYPLTKQHRASMALTRLWSLGEDDWEAWKTIHIFNWHHHHILSATGKHSNYYKTWSRLITPSYPCSGAKLAPWNLVWVTIILELNPRLPDVIIYLCEWQLIRKFTSHEYASLLGLFELVILCITCTVITTPRPSVQHWLWSTAWRYCTRTRLNESLLVFLGPFSARMYCTYHY